MNKSIRGKKTPAMGLTAEWVGQRKQCHLSIEQQKLPHLNGEKQTGERMNRHSGIHEAKSKSSDVHVIGVVHEEEEEGGAKNYLKK